MKVRISLICLALLAFLPDAAAQTPNYFPLDTGNTWMYSSPGAPAETTFKVITVEGQERLNGSDYARVRYFGGLVYLRSNRDGSLVSLNRSTGREEPWVRFGDPAGTVFEAHVDQCTSTGRINARDAEVTTPSGRFINTVEIGFQGNCGDAGAMRHFYAAGAGLVAFEESSFAGPRRYELVHFRAGSLSGGRQEVSFAIGLDAPRYKAGSNIAVRLTLRSTHPDTMTLHFPSGQSFDLKIYDSRGRTVYVWSADKIFPLIVRDERFGPGEMTFGFPVPLGALTPGRYKAQGYLTTSPQKFLAETSFEILR